MTNSQTWYIVKYKSQICEIVPSEKLEDNNPDMIEKWGTFSSQQEAIACRVGLIRAGKCQPM
ncbi:DDE transposase family protein [Sphaerospermopsis aphanizomenoides BCCUSP55]|uniref:DDE transposase family protein n=1 Tax=Sphaerospermopsis aphanizomenoides TaxID=459663 RepID=UPI001905DE61|nr:DDE transposase family protein [Sphaerospermopsis aphanizomenoides]MBK1988929.1 DDE transposase family protein [Sphaerospermopsis aphanizomenoides BCCUSP55]